MEKRSSLIPKVAYIYIALPFIIFTIGYMKWYFALVVTAAVVISLCLMFKNAPKITSPDLKDKKTLIMLGISLLIVCVWAYLSGLGGFTYQNNDHYWRNSIFEELVNREWPVVVNNEYYGGSIALVYYTAFWLPAAVIGKIAGLTAGYIFQPIWAAIGIYLVYLLLCSVNKRFSLLPIIILVFFSGLDIIEMSLLSTEINLEGLTAHIEWTLAPFQYSSFTTQLFWVFNQSIPIWIIALLMMLQASNKGIVFIISFSLLSSSLPFIGLIPFLALFAFGRKYQGTVTFKDKVIAWCKDSLSFENIIGGGLVGILTFIYLSTNSSGQIWGLSINRCSSLREFVKLYCAFAALEFGVYFLAVFKYKFKTAMFWISGVTLAVCPLITVGNSASAMDFCMRASIPALFFLAIMVIETLYEAFKKKDILTAIALSVLLVLGSVTPICEIGRTVKNTFFTERDSIMVTDSFDLLQSDDIDNFIGKTEDSFFFKYIAK